MALTAGPGLRRELALGGAVRVGQGRSELWWEFTLISSFQWQGYLHALPPPTCAERILLLAKGFGLTEMLQQRVEELSPAQRACAEVAVALLAAPAILLWAEPPGLLSPVERAQVLGFLSELSRSEGILVVTAVNEWRGVVA